MLQHLKKKIGTKTLSETENQNFSFSRKLVRIAVYKSHQFYQIGFFQQENIPAENFPLACRQGFAVSRSQRVGFVSALQEFQLHNCFFPRRRVSQKIIILELNPFKLKEFKYFNQCTQEQCRTND